MRKYLGTGILIVVLVFMVVLYLITGKTAPLKATYIYDFDDQSIKELSIVNVQGSMVFSKEDDQWMITQPARYKVNIDKIETIEKWINKFPVRRVLPESETDTTAYGLQNPEITVELKLGNGETHKIIVGDLTASKAQRYVKDVSKPYIYLVDISYISQFEGRISSYRSKEIYNIKPEQIEFMSYSKEGTSRVEVEKMDGLWYMSAPYEAKANEVVVNETLAYLRNLKAIDYVEELSPDLMQLGLDIPKHTLIIRDQEGNEQILEFGNLDGDGFIYLRNNNKEDIIKVFADEVRFDNLNEKTLLSEAPLKQNIDDVKKIEIETSDQMIELDVDAELDIYKYQGLGLDKDTFITFYVKYISLMADGYEEAVAKGNSKMTLVSYLKDGTQKVLKLYERDENSYYMQEDDKPIRFYISSERVELLSKWIEKLLP